MPKGIYKHPSHSEEWKKKMSERVSGEKNPGWKGDNVSVIGIHVWLANNKPESQVCEDCRKKITKLELANINNHIYTRNFDHYKWLCHKCHAKFDSSNRKKCKRGLHLFEGNNIYTFKDGSRVCKICIKEYNLAHRETILKSKRQWYFRNKNKGGEER